MGLLSYRALTLGLAGVVATAAVTKVAIAWKEAQRSGAVAEEPGSSLSEPVALATTPFRTDTLTPAPTSDSLTRSGAGAVDELAAMQRLSRALSQAGPRELATAAALRRFVATGAMGELHNLDRQDIVALADYLTQELTPGEVGTLLQQTLGFSADYVLNEENASSSLVDIYDALAGNRVEEVRPSPLMVTDGADADGRITGEAHTLPVGTKRVYAVFENAHALEGLDQVLAVWRDPNDDQLVFTEFEPVRQGSAYNYVWLDVESGWPAGRYQVELFHPEAQSLLLASEGFSVR